MAGIVIQSMGPLTAAQLNERPQGKAFQASAQGSGQVIKDYHLLDPDSVWWRTVHPDEGVVIFGPEIINGKFDLTSETVLQRSRLAGNNLKISPAEAKAVFGLLIDPDNPNEKLHESIMGASKFKHSSFVEKWRGVAATEIANPFKQRFDYSSMQRFLGHAVKYYAAASTLNYLKEAENARAEAIQQWETANSAYLSSGEGARNTAWVTEYNAQFLTQGTTTYQELIPGCPYPWWSGCYRDVTVANGMYGSALSDPWQTTTDPDSLTSLQNLISRTLWENEPRVIAQLGEFDPNSNFRMIAWDEGLNNYASYLNEQGGAANWQSLSSANSFWDVGNFRNEQLNPGARPENLSFATSKKFLKGFLIMGACLAGIGVLARVWGKIREDANSTFNANGFESSESWSHHTSRVLAHTIGQSTLTTWIKNLIQDHDPTQFALNAYQGGKDVVEKCKNIIQSLLTSGRRDVGGDFITSDYRLIDSTYEYTLGGQGALLATTNTIGVNVTLTNSKVLVLKASKVEDVVKEYFKDLPVTAQNWRQKVNAKMHEQFYSSAKRDAILSLAEVGVPGTGAFKIVIQDGGNGYPYGRERLGVNEHGYYIFTFDPATNRVLITGVSDLKYGLAVKPDFLDERQFLTGRFYKISHGVLLENFKELRSSLSQISNIIKTKKSTASKLNAKLVAQQQQNAKSIYWNTPVELPHNYKTANQFKHLNLKTYLDSDGNLSHIPSNNKPHQVWGVELIEVTKQNEKTQAWEEHKNKEGQFEIPDGQVPLKQVAEFNNGTTYATAPNVEDVAWVGYLNGGSRHFNSPRNPAFNILPNSPTNEAQKGIAKEVLFEKTIVRGRDRGTYRAKIKFWGWGSQLIAPADAAAGVADSLLYQNRLSDHYKLAHFYDTICKKLDAEIYKACSVINRKFQNHTGGSKFGTLIPTFSAAINNYGMLQRAFVDTRGWDLNNAKKEEGDHQDGGENLKGHGDFTANHFHATNTKTFKLNMGAVGDFNGGCKVLSVGVGRTTLADWDKNNNVHAKAKTKPANPQAVKPKDLDGNAYASNTQIQYDEIKFESMTWDGDGTIHNDKDSKDFTLALHTEFGITIQGHVFVKNVHVRRVVGGEFYSADHLTNEEKSVWGLDPKQAQKFDGRFFICEPYITVDFAEWEAVKGSVSSGGATDAEPENSQAEDDPAPETRTAQALERAVQIEMQQFNAANNIEWASMFNSQWSKLERIAYKTSRNHNFITPYPWSRAKLTNIFSHNVDPDDGAVNAPGKPATILKQIYNIVIQMPKADPNAKPGTTDPRKIGESELKALKSLTYYVPTFSRCGKNKNNISLKETFFSNQTSYNLFTASQKVDEALCGKYSCGAVHAYTRVPPIGLSRAAGVSDSNMKRVDSRGNILKDANGNNITYTDYKIDGPKDDPLPICGNATITFRFFPTQNTQVRSNLYNESVSSAFLGQTGFNISDSCLPLYEVSDTNGKVTSVKDADGNVIFTVPSKNWLAEIPVRSPGFFAKLVGKTEADYTPATADVTLPEIWGNWSNAQFNRKASGGKESWTSGWVQGALNHDNFVSSIFKIIVELFVGDVSPNLAIFHLRKASAKTRVWDYKNVGTVLGYTYDLRKAYEYHRMMQDGWAPYAHEYAGEDAISTKNPFKKGERNTYNGNSIAVYHLAHVGKILQGFYNDLALSKETWTSSNTKAAPIDPFNESTLTNNIHPSRKQFVSHVFGTLKYDNKDLSLGFRMKGYHGSPLEITENSFESYNQPEKTLTVTRTLSGLCYPVVNDYGYKWERLLLMEDSDKYYDKKAINPFENFQPRSQQRQSNGAKLGHSVFATSDNTVPLGWREIIDGIDEKHNGTIFAQTYTNTAQLSEHYGWNKTIKDYKKEILGNPNATDAEIEKAWNGDADAMVESNFPIRESQEITGPDENDVVQEVQLYTESQGTQGVGYNPWAGFDMSTNTSDYAAGEFIDSSLDNINNQEIRPPLDETFPSKNEWNDLAKAMDEKIKGMAQIFPRIYITDYKFGYQAQENTDGSLISIPINADENGVAKNTNIIDLKNFIKEYIKADKLDQNGNPSWKSDSWSAWDKAYKNAIEGNWGLEGTGSSKTAAMADLSGQALLYSEMVNKFHYLDWDDAAVNGHTTEIKNAVPMDAWGDISTDDQKAKITHTVGWGHTEEEAENNARFALETELINKLFTKAVPNSCMLNYDVTDKTTWKVQSNNPLDSFNLNWKRKSSITTTITDNPETPFCQAGIPADADDHKGCAWIPRKYEIINPDTSSYTNSQNVSFGPISDNTKNNQDKFTSLKSRYHAGNKPDGRDMGEVYKVTDGCLQPKIVSWNRPFNELYGFWCGSDVSENGKNAAKADALSQLAYVYHNVIQYGSPQSPPPNPSSFAGGKILNEPSANVNMGCQCKFPDQDALENSSQAFDPASNKWKVDNNNYSDLKNPYQVKHLSFTDYIEDSVGYIAQHGGQGTAGYRTVTNNPTIYTVEKGFCSIDGYNNQADCTSNGGTWTSKTRVSAKGSTSQEASDRVNGLLNMYKSSDNPAYGIYFGASTNNILSHSNCTECNGTLSTVESDYQNLNFIAWTHGDFSDHLYNMDSFSYNGDAGGSTDPSDWNGWGNTSNIDYCMMQNAYDSPPTANGNGYTGEYGQHGRGYLHNDTVRADWTRWAQSGKINIPVASAGSTDTTLQDLYECIQEQAFEKYIGNDTTFTNGLKDVPPGNDVLFSNMGDFGSQWYDSSHSSYLDLISDGTYTSTADGTVFVDSDTIGVNVGADATATNHYSNWDIPYGNPPNAGNAQNVNQSTCGCEQTTLCSHADAMTAGWDIPGGTSAPNSTYQCYGRVVTKNYTDGNNNIIPISLYEQVISGKATNPDGDTRCGIISQSYWGTLTHKDYDGTNSYTAKMVLNDSCETYAFEISGLCPSVDSNIHKVEVSGTLSCGLTQHKYKAGLLRNKYKGYLFASGLTPWVTGTADWTNGGITVYKNPTTKRVATRFHEQEYVVNYGTDAKAIDIDYSKAQKTPNNAGAVSNSAPINRNRGVLISSVPSANTAGHNHLSTATAWALKLGTYTQNWAKVKYNARTPKGKGPECRQRDADGNCIEIDPTWKPGFDTNENGYGDLVFMGGWDLINPAWGNATTNEADQYLSNTQGESVIIYDPSRAVGFGKKFRRQGGSKGKTVINDTASTAVKNAYVLKVNNKTYGGNSAAKQGVIHAVFYTQESYEKYIQNIHVTKNVQVLDYGSTTAASETSWINIPSIKGVKAASGAKSKTFVGVQYAILKTDTAACEHCLSTELSEVPDSRTHDYFKDKMYFGEQFFIGQKVKWDIYKGNYVFKVPLKLTGNDVKSPLDGSNVRLEDWEEAVTPQEAAFDEDLSREHYLLTTNSLNSWQPPALSCGGYSKLDKIVDFSTWTNRSWSQIPKGGIIEWNDGNMPDGVMYKGPDASSNTIVGESSSSVGNDVLVGETITSFDVSPQNYSTVIGKEKYYFRVGKMVQVYSWSTPTKYLIGEIKQFAMNGNLARIDIKVTEVSATFDDPADKQVQLIAHPYNMLFDGGAYDVLSERFPNKGKAITNVTERRNVGTKSKDLDLSKGAYDVEGADNSYTSNTWGS